MDLLMFLKAHNNQTLFVERGTQGRVTTTTNCFSNTLKGLRLLPQGSNFPICSFYAFLKVRNSPASHERKLLDQKFASGFDFKNLMLPLSA
jgi:hypothetical protein